jgi:hypothetical protein
MMTMDVTILRLTVALEIAILAGLLWRRLFLLVPLFTFTIFCCLVEPIPAMHLYYHGHGNQYYLAYYAIDLFNIALYSLCIVECRCRGYLCGISISMGIYLAFKAASYGLMATHHVVQSIALHGQLRFANLACYLVWGFMVWGYDVFGVQSSKR